jgi:choloylglycine hydrolase
VYYFETALTPNTFWVDLAKLDFSEKAKPKKLDLSNNKTYTGESSKFFVAALPFQFIGL